MGSMLWATDMIINDYIKPMNNAYNFQQYETSANFLWQLNNFFLGYGVGIKDLPAPRLDGRNMRDRSSPEITFKAYFEKYSPKITMVMGKYVRSVIDDIKLSQEQDY